MTSQYEFIKQNNFMGLSMGLIRRFASQILTSLRFMKVGRGLGGGGGAVGGGAVGGGGGRGRLAHLASSPPTRAPAPDRT